MKTREKVYENALFEMRSGDTYGAFSEQELQRKIDAALREAQQIPESVTKTSPDIFVKTLRSTVRTFAGTERAFEYEIYLGACKLQAFRTHGYNETKSAKEEATAYAANVAKELGVKVFQVRAKN